MEPPPPGHGGGERGAATVPPLREMDRDEPHGGAKYWTNEGFTPAERLVYPAPTDAPRCILASQGFGSGPQAARPFSQGTWMEPRPIWNFVRVCRRRRE